MVEIDIFRETENRFSASGQKFLFYLFIVLNWTLRWPRKRKNESWNELSSMRVLLCWRKTLKLSQFRRTKAFEWENGIVTVHCNAIPYCNHNRIKFFISGAIDLTCFCAHNIRCKWSNHSEKFPNWNVECLKNGKRRLMNKECSKIVHLVTDAYCSGYLAKWCVVHNIALYFFYFEVGRKEKTRKQKKLQHNFTDSNASVCFSLPFCLYKLEKFGTRSNRVESFES